MPVDLEIGGMADHEPLQPPRLRIEAGQAHQLSLDLFPIGQGIDEEALVPVYGDDHPTLGALDERLPVTPRDDHAALGIEGDLCCTAKHDLGATESPISPHFLPLGGTIYVESGGVNRPK